MPFTPEQEAAWPKAAAEAARYLYGETKPTLDQWGWFTLEDEAVRAWWWGEKLLVLIDMDAQGRYTIDLSPIRGIDLLFDAADTADIFDDF